MKYLFVGDSITDCGHLWEKENLGNGYVRVLQERFREKGDHLMINKGQDGFTAKMLLPRLASICQVSEADVITILVGINDVSEYMQGCGSVPAAYRAYLEQLADIAQNYCDHVVFMEPFLIPWPKEYESWLEALKEYQTIVDQVAKEKNCYLVPLGRVFEHACKIYELSALTEDGTHPGKLGHQLIADAWQETVAEHVKLC